MTIPARVGVDFAGLSERAETAASGAERAACLRALDEALAGTVSLEDRGKLLLLRARVHSNDWRTAEVLVDARAALACFEGAGDDEAALDAASLAAAFASRLGELSLAAELSTRCIVSLDEVRDDRLRIEIANRLGIVCYSFLDYERAVEQFEVGLAAAERCGDLAKTYRQLHNIADALLLAARQERAAGIDRAGVCAPEAGDRPALRSLLERAESALERLQAVGTPEMHFHTGSRRLRAELLLERGRPGEAFVALEGADGALDGVVPDAQRAALARVEARCLRELGATEQAAATAGSAVELARKSRDYLEIMLALEERVAARQEAGDLEGALADALEVRRHMWVIHRRQTAQVVEQVWERAGLERDRRGAEARAIAALRTAEEDPLTRIGNRRLLERLLGQLARTKAELALLITDIDHFKEINDTFGHDVGDTVLRELGELFATSVRAAQAVVRYGGEEFVFALPEVSLAAASAFGERIRERVASGAWAASDLDTGLFVTVSVGVAHGPADRWQSVLAAADRSLYVAKRRGRNRVQVG